MNLPSRVLICGSYQWRWPDAITTTLDHLAGLHPEDLVVIEECGRGAERTAHDWCTQRNFRAWRHRCYPPADNKPYRSAHQIGPECNRRLLTDEEPRLVLAFHEDLKRSRPALRDLCEQAADMGIPVWHLATGDLQRGCWWLRAPLDW